MINFKGKIRIKLFLFIFALICSLVFFAVNWYLVNQFRSELNKQVETIVNIFHDKLNNETIDSDYLLKTLLPLIDDLDIPMIITTKTSEITGVKDLDGDNVEYIMNNVNISNSYNNDKKFKDEIEKVIYLMDKNNSPLTIIEDGHKPMIQLHYGDPVIINNLRWISYLEFGFIFFILLLFFSSIYLILSSEKNYIYVGMARETAHQLGTPISSLMGWLKLLENKNENVKEIYSAMQKDVDKLNNISHKFNKIGSKPKFKKIELIIILEEVVNYYKSKLPKNSKIKLNFNVSNTKNIYMMGDDVLLYWAFENLVKNSIDSLIDSSGKIDLFFLNKNDSIIIDFIDNGRGISRKNKRNIFRPGFSTKLRGWGLGLNLTKRIIEGIHKGSILLVKSNSQQTIFRVKLKSIIS